MEPAASLKGGGQETYFGMLGTGPRMTTLVSSSCREEAGSGGEGRGEGEGEGKGEGEGAEAALASRQRRRWRVGRVMATGLLHRACSGFIPVELRSVNAPSVSMISSLLLHSTSWEGCKPISCPANCPSHELTVTAGQPEETDKWGSEVWTGE